MRLVQLTALAYCVGFVTDVFDDGASARMDGTPTTGTRLTPEDLDDALPAPPPTPAASAQDRDDEGAFLNASDERADAARFLPRECVHSVSDGRPKLTHNEQQRTSKIIAHVARRMKASDEFTKLLQLVAMRESSMQQGLVHRLSPDLEGSYSAWRKMQKTYEGNPHADEVEAWQTYGLFGMNSNYFTLLWDKAADPRVLCDAVVDVLVYRRAAARMIRKAGGNIVCKDEHGNPYDYTTRATWETIHRAVSGGKLCPGKREATAATMSKFFRSRAERVGIDPDRPVTLKMLGMEPEKGLDGAPWADQEAVVMGLWSEVEAAAAAEQDRADQHASKTATTATGSPNEPNEPNEPDEPDEPARATPDRIAARQNSR